MTDLISNTNIATIIIILSITCMILLVLCIILIVLINKLKNRFDKFMGTKSTRHNIEDILIDYYDYVTLVDSKYTLLQENINDIYSRLIPCIQKIGIVRYNPFDNMGGDLSYALALMDENNDGILFNTIFARDSSHTYCKPISKGKSEYNLCYEEELAIKRALGLDKKSPRGTGSHTE